MKISPKVGAQRKKQRYWMITGYDSLNKIYENKIKSGCISEAQLINLLKALTAKAALTNDEIIGAFAKKGTTISNEHLHVNKDNFNQVYTCGENIHFTARIIDGD